MRGRGLQLLRYLGLLMGLLGMLAGCGGIVGVAIRVGRCRVAGPCPSNSGSLLHSHPRPFARHSTKGWYRSRRGKPNLAIPGLSSG